MRTGTAAALRASSDQVNCEVTLSSVNEQTGVAAPALVVVIVAPNKVRGRQLRGLLGGPSFAVAAVAVSAEEAESAVVRYQPDAVLLDLSARDGGLDAIERIMGTRPTPIVVCGEAALHAPDALAAGAVDVVGPLDASPGAPEYAIALRRHLKVASRVRVITHPRSRLRKQEMNVRAAARRSSAGLRVVIIGASTGGPPALATILADLPVDLPVPVLVVQHMADGFVEGLASWLDSLCPLRVVMAQDGIRLIPGTVYVAPAGVNTLLRHGLRIETRAAALGQYHVPGVDAAFASAAATCAGDALGVLLTGMGRDGADGLLTLRQSGAMTIGQDEPSSVVWGMPAAAQALGAVAMELPLSEIAAAIVAAVAAPVQVSAGGDGPC
jgi:two-component system, chemotaxis family, protein-glutamate methylesterase/glutaminase